MTMVDSFTSASVQSLGRVGGRDRAQVRNDVVAKRDDIQHSGDRECHRHEAPHVRLALCVSLKANNIPRTTARIAGLPAPTE